MSAFTAKLIHTCTIQQRAGTSSTDDWEGESWTDAATGVRCLHQRRTERELNTRTMSSTRVQQDVLYMERRTVTQQDRVTNIVDRNGTVLEAGPFDITGVVDMGGQGRFLKVYLKRPGR